MNPHRLALLAAIALAALSGSAQDAAPGVTTLKVILPQKSGQVLVDGKAISKKGDATREFAAPALAPGKKDYDVTVTWRTNNYTRFYRKTKAAAKPGATVAVDLSRPIDADPDRIEIRWVPTPDDVVKRMCELGRIAKDDVVYDLGCGDGRMVIMGVRDFAAKRGVGVDLFPDKVAESKDNAMKAGVSDKVAFRVGDVLDIKDLADASVVLLYMGDDVNLRLRPILQKTLKPGSRIVSHRFLMGDWKPEKTEKFTAADGDEYEIHLWEIGKK